MDEVLTKTCTKCGEVKPLDQFYKDKTGKFGRSQKCVICARSQHREAHAVKGKEWYQSKKARREERMSEDKEYAEAVRRRWAKKMSNTRAAHPDRERERELRWRAENPDRYYERNKERGQQQNEKNKLDSHLSHSLFNEEDRHEAAHGNKDESAKQVFVRLLASAAALDIWWGYGGRHKTAAHHSAARCLSSRGYSSAEFAAAIEELISEGKISTAEVLPYNRGRAPMIKVYMTGGKLPPARI